MFLAFYRIKMNPHRVVAHLQVKVMLFRNEEALESEFFREPYMPYAWITLV